MASNFIKIKTLTGSIFGNVTINNYSSNSSQQNEEAECVDFEEVTEQEKTVTTTDNSARSSERSSDAVIQEYLERLSVLAVPRYTSSFSDLISNIIKDNEIQQWLHDTSHCTFKPFNKNRVFRLARMLKNKGVLSFESESVLNEVLEKNIKDTTYRKSMSNFNKRESQIENQIEQIMKKFD